MNGEVLSFGDLEVSDDYSLQSYAVVNWEGQLGNYLIQKVGRGYRREMGGRRRKRFKKLR